MELSRQEYWSGLPFPSPGDPPDPGTEPGCPASQADSLLTAYLLYLYCIYKALFSVLRISLVAQMVKRLSTMWETWVRSLGRERLLEREMANHSSTLAWRIPWMEEPGGLQSMGSQGAGHN